MTDPLPLRDCKTGPEAILGRALEAACEDVVPTPEARAEVWWGLRSWFAAAADPARPLAPLAPRRRHGPRSRSAFVLGGAVAAGAIAVAFVGALLAARGLSSSVSADEAQRAALGASGGRTQPGTPRLPCEAWTRLDRGDVGTFEFPSAAQLDIRELDALRVVRLDSGLLRAQVVKQDPSLPFTVVTPQLRITVLGTRFDVIVASGRSRIDLTEGRVLVESTAGSVVLNAGESIASDDPRLAPPPPPLPPPAETSAQAAVPELGYARARTLLAARSEGIRPTRRDCDQERSADQLVACLRRIGAGADLAAQSALFELGLLQRGQSRGDALALETFGEYERRFPDGLLAPEVSLRTLAILRANGRLEAALEEALRFESRFPEDPRLPEVQLARAELSCGDPDQSGAVARILGRLEADGSLRAEAARVRARCALRSSDGPDPTINRPEPLGGAPPGQ